MEIEQRKRAMHQKFRMRGFTLNKEALHIAMTFLEESLVADDEAVTLLLSELDKISLKSNVLSKAAILEVIASLTGNIINEQMQLSVVDAANIPKFCYDPVRKVFHRYTGSLLAHGEAASKAALYRDRFQLLQQRIARDKHFAKPSFCSTGSRSGTCEMTALQSLVGTTGRRWVMGTISQIEDGLFVLEDLTASVAVDFSQAKITTGFFIENSVIVAEGDLMSNGTFMIHTLGFPPLENRAVSLSVTAGLDFFGAGVLNPDEIIRLEQMEKMAVNDMFIVLSEIWLDQEETMQKLSQVLSGYESVDVVPSLFILLGNFCSQPCNIAFHRFTDLRSHFSKLGKLISKHPRIMESSRFLFVPGPDDPGPGNVLPRPPLPNYFTKEIRKYLPNAIFSSNPCRLRFFSQEIVIFREDLLYRMRRNCIVNPSDEETKDPFEHLVATVLHQSHLCPLPLMVQPIRWPHDHTLRLYPTPHTIVLADRTEQKVFKYTGVTCFSPGSFSNDGTFVAYRPSSQEPELSCL